MTNYENIPQLVYPKGVFEKAYDTVLITGEVYRCAHMSSHLGPKDKAYQVSIKISLESFKELRQPMNEDRRMTGLKKVELKVKKLDADGEPLKDSSGNWVYEEDEMGDPIKEFSHYQITIRQNKEIKGEEVRVPVCMVDSNEPITDRIAEGTKITVLAQCYPTVYQDKPAMGLNWKSAKVHELQILEGGSNDNDAWAALGMSAPVTPQQEKKEESQSKPVNTSGAGFDGDDLDDDIPF